MGWVTPAFDDLAQEVRWVAWRNERRGDKLAKVPYSPGGRGRAKADDPLTWGTRAEAETRAVNLINGLGGGIGFELGDLGSDTYLGGVDLDSCIEPDGTLAAWAEAIVAVVPSYAEVSPSGAGLKLFFYVAKEDVCRFLDLVNVANPDQWGFKRSVGEEVIEHGPAVEIYFARRFFTVTGNLWQTSPQSLSFIDWLSLEQLAALIPRARSNDGSHQTRRRDNSRSARAMAKGAVLRRGGATYNEMVEGLRTDPETSDWVETKGRVSGNPELRRIWQKTGEADPAVAELNAEFALVLTGGKSGVLRERITPEGWLDWDLLTTKAFGDWLKNRFVAVPDGKSAPLADHWMRHPQRCQFDNIVFAPGRDAGRAY